MIAVDRGGGPSTIVADGETGWLVEPDDRAAMTSAMVEAVNAPELIAKRGRRARAAVEARYTWEQVGREIGELIEGAVAQKREPLPVSS